MTNPDAAGRRRALGLVSLAVLLASSTWFSGTAAAPVLKKTWDLSDVQASWLTIAVQLGFIAGTFIFALLNLADVFKSRRVFFFSALAGAVFNAAFALFSRGLGPAVFLRFLTGLTLAGVYPVGMKIVAQWYRRGLGWGLGVMVGALTLGTALPYLILALGGVVRWRVWVSAASGLAVVGGLIVRYVLGDGPYLGQAARFDFRAAFRLFGHRPFLLQSLGYFGHMGELYALWSLGGFFIAARFIGRRPLAPETVSLLMFAVVAAGTAGCVLGGLLSRRRGARTVALSSLSVSAICGLLSSLIFTLQGTLFVLVMLVWGAAAVADSAQFSALAAEACPAEYTGTALTIQNGIGFAVTVISIPLVARLGQIAGWRWAFTALAIGPVLGALALSRLKTLRSADDRMGFRERSSNTGLR